MRAPTVQRIRLGGAVATALVAMLLTGCGSASTPAPASSSALDPTTPIAIEDVDACRLLTPAAAESVTGVSMTAGVAPSIAGSPPDRTLCEYLPTAEPVTSATTVQFSALTAKDSPFTTYAAGVEPFAEHCVETAQPPATTPPGAAAICAYQTITVAGVLPGFVAYPGKNRDGSQLEPVDERVLQLNWWAGGLTFLLMSSTPAGSQSAASIRAVADQIARTLA